MTSRDAEEGYALALLPWAKDIADYVRAHVPPDTDWGVLLFAEPPEGQEVGRIIALTSDRHRVATYAAQWVLDVLGRPETDV